MLVTKRNGSKEPLCVEKLRKVLNFACEGMPDYVSVSELEGSIDIKLHDGISTREIQENAYITAAELTTNDKPAYRYVAGRLLLYNYRKETVVKRGYDYYTKASDGSGDLLSQYYRHVKSHTDKGLYSDQLLKNYSPDELIEAGYFIVPERDNDYDYAGGILLVNRYTLEDELPQEAFLSCALLLASIEKPENRLKKAREIYDAVSLRKISLATPMLAQLRIPKGNLSSCFITMMDDSLESIFHEITNAARISSKGGGLGVNVSAIRAVGSDVGIRTNASKGVMSWVKILNDTALAVDQGKQICLAV